MATLYLNLKKQWFDMISSGEKKEEYREQKEFWCTRLMSYGIIKRLMKAPEKEYFEFREFDTITFRNGYAKNAPTLVVECLGITIGPAVPEWSDNWPGDVFIIKLGKIIEIL